MSPNPFIAREWKAWTSPRRSGRRVICSALVLVLIASIASVCLLSWQWDHEGRDQLILSLPSFIVLVFAVIHANGWLAGAETRSLLEEMRTSRISPTTFVIAAMVPFAFLLSLVALPALVGVAAMDMRHELHTTGVFIPEWVYLTLISVILSGPVDVALTMVLFAQFKKSLGVFLGALGLLPLRALAVPFVTATLGGATHRGPLTLGVVVIQILALIAFWSVRKSTIAKCADRDVRSEELPA